MAFSGDGRPFDSRLSRSEPCGFPRRLLWRVLTENRCENAINLLACCALSTFCLVDASLFRKAPKAIAVFRQNPP